MRNERGKGEAARIEAIRGWLSALGPEDRRRATAVFGEIDQIAHGDPAQRAMLFKYGVLAFESLKSKQGLNVLSSASGKGTVGIGDVIEMLDGIESPLYHLIVSGRIEVLRALNRQMKEDEEGHTIHKYLFDHLWLLDPSWEHTTATGSIDSSVQRAFSQIDESLSHAERASRIGIRYQMTAGKHVIVELKRPMVLTTTFSLLNQIEKYISVLRKMLRELGEERPHIEVLCVVGREPSDWSDPGGRDSSEQKLNPWGIRVLLYNQMIDSTLRAYQEFINKSGEADGIVRLFREIDEN